MLLREQNTLPFEDTYASIYHLIATVDALLIESTEDVGICGGDASLNILLPTTDVTACNCDVNAHLATNLVMHLSSKMEESTTPRVDISILADQLLTTINTLLVASKVEIAECDKAAKLFYHDTPAVALSIVTNECDEVTSLLQAEQMLAGFLVQMCVNAVSSDINIALSRLMTVFDATLSRVHGDSNKSPQFFYCRQMC